MIILYLIVFITYILIEPIIESPKRLVKKENHEASSGATFNGPTQYDNPKPSRKIINPPHSISNTNELIVGSELRIILFDYIYSKTTSS